MLSSFDTRAPHLSSCLVVVLSVLHSVSVAVAKLALKELMDFNCLSLPVLTLSLSQQPHDSRLDS